MLRGIALIWGGFVLGWEAARLANFIPTRQNLLGGFLNVPFVYFLILLGAEAMKHAQARREEELQAGALPASSPRPVWRFCSGSSIRTSSSMPSRRSRPFSTAIPRPRTGSSCACPRCCAPCSRMPPGRP